MFYQPSPRLHQPFTNSIEQWARNCRIVYDKFHVLQHANKAIDEVRRAEFFRKGGRMRGVVKGKRWLLLTRWMNLDSQKRQQLNQLFALNRRVMKAYLFLPGCLLDAGGSWPCLICVFARSQSGHAQDRRH